MIRREVIQQLIASRKPLVPTGNALPPRRKTEAEGGCGVIGVACSERIAGHHLLQALKQMRNRGNNKGGGIAAVGLIPEELGVTREILEGDYLLSIAYLDPSARTEVERTRIDPMFHVDHVRHAPSVDDFNRVKGIEIQPPDVYQYFVQPKADVMEEFQKSNGLGADGCVLGTSELVALGCTRCANCERGRGCPFGLTTTDPELSQLVDPDWGASRISNLYASIQLQLRDILRRLGLSRISELRGKTELLVYRNDKVSRND